MTAVEITKALVEGNFTPDEINAMISAIKLARSQATKRAAAVAAATFNYGTEVRVSGIRPNYLNGLTGKIVSFSPRRTHADIEIVNSNDYRVSVGSVQRGFPLSCLSEVK